MAKTTTKLTLAVALAQLTSFINTHAESPVNEVIAFDGGSITLSTFSDHAAFAAAYFNVCDLAGAVKKPILARAATCKNKISQFRYAIVSFDDGARFEKLGLSAIRETEGVRIDTPTDLAFVKTFFGNTNPELLVTFVDNGMLNTNYSALPKIPTLAELSPKYPKLAELQVEGVKINIKAKNLAHVSFDSVDSLDGFFIKASHLQPADTVRLASNNVYLRKAGTSEDFGSMNKNMFKQVLADQFDTLDVYAVLNLV